MSESTQLSGRSSREDLVAELEQLGYPEATYANLESRADLFALVEQGEYSETEETEEELTPEEENTQEETVEGEEETEETEEELAEGEEVEEELDLSDAPAEGKVRFAHRVKCNGRVYEKGSEHELSEDLVAEFKALGVLWKPKKKRQAVVTEDGEPEVLPEGQYRMLSTVKCGGKKYLAGEVYELDDKLAAHFEELEVL